MAEDYGLNAIKRESKKLALLQHKNDSDEQLKEIVERNLRLMIPLQYRDDSTSHIEFFKLSGELEGCSEILDSRKKAVEAADKAVKDWLAQFEQRREAAIMNLPYATSANGQLVASILEEDSYNGMTAEEIRGWYDELMMLDDDEYQALLDNLVSEGVLTFDDEEQKYYLNRICDSTLVSVPDGSVIAIKMMKSGMNSEMGMAAGVITIILKKASVPKSAEELLSYLNNLGLGSLNLNRYDVQKACKEMVRLGYLSDNEMGNKYFIRIMGEVKE